MELTYNGFRVNAGGGCETAVTARTRCGWANFSKYYKLLYGKRFLLKLKGAVYSSNICQKLCTDVKYCACRKARWKYY